MSHHFRRGMSIEKEERKKNRYDGSWLLYHVPVNVCGEQGRNSECEWWIRWQRRKVNDGENEISFPYCNSYSMLCSRIQTATRARWFFFSKWDVKWTCLCEYTVHSEDVLRTRECCSFTLTDLSSKLPGQVILTKRLTSFQVMDLNKDGCWRKMFRTRLLL